MRKVLIFILMVLAGSPALADTIQLKSGRIVKGRIINETPIFVRIETNEAIRTQEFLTSKIEKIIRGDEMSSSWEEPSQPASSAVTEPSAGESAVEPQPVPEKIDESPVPEPVKEPSVEKADQPALVRKNVFSNEDLLSIQGKTDKEVGFYELKPIEPTIDTSLTLSGWAVCGIIFLLMLLLGFKPALQTTGQTVSQTAAAAPTADQVLSIRKLIGIARFQLIWYNAIVKNDASIKEPFRTFKKAGNSLFKFYFFLGLVMMMVFVGLGIWLFLILKDSLAALNQFSNWSWTIWVNLFGPRLLP